jgi:hypothetical protein
MKHITVFAFSAVAMLVAGHAAAADKLALPQAVSSQDLAGMSGGANTAVALTNQSLNAVNSGNTLTADSLTTGDVTLQSNAFSGFNGIGNFVFNTGNNNNVQGTLSVTIIAPH